MVGWAEAVPVDERARLAALPGWPESAELFQAAVAEAALPGGVHLAASASAELLSGR